MIKSYQKITVQFSPATFSDLITQIFEQLVHRLHTYSSEAIKNFHWKNAWSWSSERSLNSHVHRGTSCIFKVGCSIAGAYSSVAWKARERKTKRRRRKKKKKRKKKKRSNGIVARYVVRPFSAWKRTAIRLAGCHRRFSLVRERPQTVWTRSLGLIDRLGCFRPLGRPRYRRVGQLDADMAVRFHVRSITRDSRRTGGNRHAYCVLCIYHRASVWPYISCSTDDIL